VFAIWPILNDAMLFFFLKVICTDSWIFLTAEDFRNLGAFKDLSLFSDLSKLLILISETL
jgi:hypothetical protein